MNYSVNEQLSVLLWSFVLGLGAGAVYCVFGGIRTFFGKKYVVFILDVVFMILLTFATALFSIGFSRGYTRYFTVLGEFAGFILFRVTAGRVVKFSVGKSLVVFSLVYKKIEEYSSKTAKKLLQVLRFLLYNIIRRKISSAESAADINTDKRGEKYREAESAQK